jgi:uncharacterized CHY-type Zn-finger protein
MGLADKCRDDRDIAMEYKSRIKNKDIDKTIVIGGLIPLMDQEGCFYHGPKDQKEMLWYECPKCHLRFNEHDLYWADRPEDDFYNGFLCPSCKTRSTRDSIEWMTFEEHQKTYPESFERYVEAKEAKYDK